MVRVLALLFSLLATPALAQGSFVTIISPSTLTTSTPGTVTTSATGSQTVICVSGCAAAGGTTVISPAAGTSAFTVSTATMTAPVSTTGVVLITPNGTISTSATGLTTISNSPLAVQVTSLFGGTLTVSQAAGVAAVNVTNTPTVSPSGVLTTSGSVIVTNTTTVSPSGVLTTSGTVTIALSPPTVLITSANTISANVTNTVTTSQAAGVLATNVTNTPTVSQAAGVLATNVTNTVTTSLTAATTVTASLATSSFVDTISQDPTGYAQRGTWVSGSGTTSTTAVTAIIKAPAANKLYIMGIQCGRTDSPSTGAIQLQFNAGTTTQYMIIPNTSATAANNMVFSPPVATSATTSLNFNANGNINAVFCNAQGFNAP